MYTHTCLYNIHYKNIHLHVYKYYWYTDILRKNNICIEKHLEECTPNYRDTVALSGDRITGNFFFLGTTFLFEILQVYFYIREKNCKPC